MIGEKKQLSGYNTTLVNSNLTEEQQVELKCCNCGTDISEKMLFAVGEAIEDRELGQPTTGLVCNDCFAEWREENNA